MIRISPTLAVFKKHAFALSMLVLVLLGLFSGILAWSRRPRADQGESQISAKSQTASLRILASERTNLGAGAVLAIRLQNVSQKEIQAYIISNGNSWVTRNYFLSDEPLAPEATVDHLIPVSEDDDEGLKAFAKSTGTYQVAAVIFSDGSVDGDDRFGRMLADKRAGTRDQVRKVLPYLRNLSLNRAEREQVLTDLKARIEALPDVADGSKAPDYVLGLKNAKTELLRQVSTIKDQVDANRLEEAGNRHQKLIKILEKLDDDRK